MHPSRRRAVADFFETNRGLLDRVADKQEAPLEANGPGVGDALTM